MDKRIISFCLWGSDPKYNTGAIKNAELTPHIYAGWKARFYVARTTPSDLIDSLLQKGAEVIPMDGEGDYLASMWRFLAASDPSVSVMISRDCDSRINYREKLAVDDWLRSNKGFHIMRDHPAHRYPIMAGMWGVRRGVLPNISEMIEGYAKRINQWGVDQWFLADVIYPLIKHVAVVHDEFFQRLPFPQARQGGEYVGEIYDQFDHPDLPLRNILIQVLNQQSSARGNS